MLNQNESNLLKELALAHDDLVESNIAFTDSYIGEFGEFYASRLLGLTRFNRSYKGADASDKLGKRYQIKCRILSKPGFNYKIKVTDSNSFDYLVIVHLNEFFELIGMYQIGAVAENATYSISASALSNQLDIKKIKISADENKKIIRFSKALSNVKSLSFCKSGNLVGNVGEYLAAKRLNLTLAKSNQKGFDAVDEQGRKYEIKSRRVYDSSRRNSETRRINNLVGKETDFLIIVILDHDFACSGMWLLDPSKILNPKSANLKIINTTDGVLNLVPSKISYLKDRDLYAEPLNKKLVKKKAIKKGPAVKDDKIEKKEVIEKKKYPGYLFAIPAIIFYIAVIIPNTSFFEGLFYFALVSLFAHNRYEKANREPRKPGKPGDWLEALPPEFKAIRERGRNNPHADHEVNNPKQIIIKKYKSNSKKSALRKNINLDIHVDCECEGCLNGYCDGDCGR